MGFASSRLCVFALEKADARRELVDEESTRSKSKEMSAFICVIRGFSWVGGLGALGVLVVNPKVV